jgi:hypothetical protein
VAGIDDGEQGHMLAQVLIYLGTGTQKRRAIVQEQASIDKLERYA